MSLAGSLPGRIAALRRSSILRLSLLLSLVSAVGMAVAISVALDLGDDAALRRIDTSLEALAAATTLQEPRSDAFSVIVRSPDDLEGLPQAFERAVRRDGGTVMLEREFRRSDSWRVLVTRDASGAPVMIAVPLDDTEEALDLLAGILWATALVVIVLTITIGIVAGLLAQRRVARISTVLDQLAGGDLAARTGTARSRDDLDDIAHRLDTTAAELERLVTQTRHLSASLAHDLRTPLARLRSRLEMLPEGEPRGAALEEAGRLAGIFDTIMRVARIEAAQGRDGFEPVALGPLVEELAETFGPVVDDAGKTLSLYVADPAVVPADRAMLVQAVANLIQNALVHGGDIVTLIADGHRLGVADNGPGVDPALYAEIVKPMVRLDEARGSDGTGLGLALVRAVADRHGAELALSRNGSEGLRVILNLAEK